MARNTSTYLSYKYYRRMCRNKEKPLRRLYYYLLFKFYNKLDERRFMDE